MESGSENYYDILNVRSDCSAKEIRAAYVELSKKFHPDVKSVKAGTEQTARFLKIAEAYRILSKPSTREEYDRNRLAAQSARAYESTSSTTNAFHRPWEIKPDYDPNPGPYYGIKGFNRIANSKVALFFIVLGIFGGVFGVTSIKRSFSLKNKHLDAVSANASAHHQKVRSEAERCSKDEQIQRVIERVSSRGEI